MNVFFKIINKSWDFVSNIWRSEKEINEENKNSFNENVESYLRSNSRHNLYANLYANFLDIFDLETLTLTEISSQKELDENFIELENKAVLFQKEISEEEDDIKNFEGKNFIDLRKYFLEIMVDKFKEMNNDEQKKILEEMVQKLNSLSAEELKNFKDKMNINDITNESVKKIVLGGGIYSMFAGAVGIIGFPAYIFLTSFIGGISSIIGITLPFGVYTASTSVMAFLSAWFWPIILAGGWFFSDKYTTKLRKIFAVASMVSISFQSYNDVDMETVNDFIKVYNVRYNLDA